MWISSPHFFTRDSVAFVKSNNSTSDTFANIFNGVPFAAYTAAIANRRTPIASTTNTCSKLDHEPNSVSAAHSAPTTASTTNTDPFIVVL